MSNRILQLALSLSLAAALPAFAGDKDNDRIPDNIDGCPTQAEDKDLFKDNDGCPDPDDDADKVCDPIINETNRLGEFTGVCKGVDKCPAQAEDLDGFEDEDGCPDLDNDKDSIADKSDKCPIVAEDFDKFEDEDGCPDLDNDKDGIADTFDKCPLEAEVKNGVEDDDGCPDVAEKALDPLMTLPVGFETGTTTINYNGKLALDDIAKRMVAWTKVTAGIRVWEARKAKVANPKLKAKEDSTLLVTTEAKANAIAKYLADQGVALERLQIKGEGAWEAVTPEEKALAKPGAHKVLFEVISGGAPAKPAVTTP